MKRLNRQFNVSGVKLTIIYPQTVTKKQYASSALDFTAQEIVSNPEKHQHVPIAKKIILLTFLNALPS